MGKIGHTRGNFKCRQTPEYTYLCFCLHINVFPIHLGGGIRQLTDWLESAVEGTMYFMGLEKSATCRWSCMVPSTSRAPKTVSHQDIMIQFQVLQCLCCYKTLPPAILGHQCPLALQQRRKSFLSCRNLGSSEIT